MDYQIDDVLPGVEEMREFIELRLTPAVEALSERSNSRVRVRDLDALCE